MAVRIDAPVPGRQRVRGRLAQTPAPSTLAHQVGAAMVEMAIVMLLFLLLLMGVIDFGRGIAAYNTISYGAREGARAAAYYDTSNYKDVEDAVDAQTSLLPGLTASDGFVVSVVDADGTLTRNGPGSTWPLGTTVRVSITYYFEAATPLIEGFVPGGLKLVASAQTIVQ